MPLSLQRFAFTVVGKVQGVHFRKYTKRKADELGIRGWVMNHADGSVIGEAEGTERILALFERWLREEGSPKSRIDSVTLSERTSTEAFTFADFRIRM